MINQIQINQIKNNFDKAGYIPIIGTAIGAIRITGGTIKSAISAISAIGYLLFGNISIAEKHETKAKEGIALIIRGIIELIPILGGISLYNLDLLLPEDY
jgi:hypothetical protein